MSVGLRWDSLELWGCRSSLAGALVPGEGEDMAMATRWGEPETRPCVNVVEGNRATIGRG
jgi:hypothetical protein